MQHRGPAVVERGKTAVDRGREIVGFGDASPGTTSRLPGSATPRKQTFELGLNYCRDGAPPMSLYSSALGGLALYSLLLVAAGLFDFHRKSL